jgi:prephenate dehydrogenase
VRVVVPGGFGRYGSWVLRLCREAGAEVEAFGPNQKHALGRALKEADVAILAVPMSESVAVASQVRRCLPEDGLIIDMTGFKVPVYAMLSSAPQALSLVHGMCGPPAEEQPVGLGEEALLVALEKISGRAEDWYWRKFRPTMGGREVASSPTDHDTSVALVQAVPHQMLLSYAETIISEEKSIDWALERATPISRPILQSLRRFLERGTPEIFAEIQAQIAGDQRVASTVRKFAEFAGLVVGQAKAYPHDRSLLKRWTRSREKLILGIGVAS